MVGFSNIRAKLNLLRKLTKKEQFDLELVSKYLDKSNLKRVEKLVKQNRAKIIKKKLDLSFLISGSTLLPSVISETEDFKKLNKIIGREHKLNLFENFSDRAYEVIPQFIASQNVGFVEEKQAVTLALFSNLKLLFINEGQELVNSAKAILENNADNFVYARNISTVKVTQENLVFFLKKPKTYSFEEIVDAVLIDNQKQVSYDDLAFIREYAKYVEKKQVKLPRHLFKHVYGFVKKKRASKFSYNVGEAFVRGVIELAKGSARIEQRMFITHKDLERAFRIAEKANKK